MRQHDAKDELKITQWYAEQVYYNMDHALEELVWLIQNVNRTAFDDIVEFYLEHHKLNTSKNE